MTDKWTDRLSEYIDEELTRDERAQLEAHLPACRECTATLEELRAVVSRAANLPHRAPAEDNDLWPGIEARLSAQRPGAVVPFQARAMRRFTFTLPQLVAAGLALMVMSGGGVWVLQHGGRATSMPPIAATTEPPPSALPAGLADPRYDEAISDLEQALAAGRSELDATTIKILEANLATIDKAIDDSRKALAADPANVYLNNHLADARQRKLALLRRATALVGTKG
jgi:tetratricopeptide (TPR) repeat protein